jgi:hypothetical protein
MYRVCVSCKFYSLKGKATHNIAEEEDNREIVGVYYETELKDVKSDLHGQWTGAIEKEYLLWKYPRYSKSD